MSAQTNSQLFQCLLESKQYLNQFDDSFVTHFISSHLISYMIFSHNCLLQVIIIIFFEWSIGYLHLSLWFTFFLQTAILYDVYVCTLCWVKKKRKEQPRKIIQIHIALHEYICFPIQIYIKLTLAIYWKCVKLRRNTIMRWHPNPIINCIAWWYCVCLHWIRTIKIRINFLDIFFILSVFSTVFTLICVLLFNMFFYSKMIFLWKFLNLSPKYLYVLLK